MKNYQEVLNEFGFSQELTVGVVLEELEQKLNRELERLDVMISKGEEERAEVKRKEVEKIEAAKEIAEQKYQELVQGIVLDTETDDNKVKKLQKQRAERDAYYEFAGATNETVQGSALENDDEVEFQKLMDDAAEAVRMRNWDSAKNKYDEALNIDPENGEAYLGLWMAKFKIHPLDVPRDCWQIQKNQKIDPFDDNMCVRARRWGTDDLKKRIDDYRKSRDYLVATEACQRAVTDEEYREAARLFGELGDFADAKKRQEECEFLRKNQRYEDALKKLNDAESKEEYENADNAFLQLGDFKDAMQRSEECKKNIDYILLKEKNRVAYNNDLKQFKNNALTKDNVNQHRQNIEKLLNQKLYINFQLNAKHHELKWGTIFAILGMVVWRIAYLANEVNAIDEESMWTVATIPIFFIIFFLIDSKKDAYILDKIGIIFTTFLFGLLSLVCWGIVEILYFIILLMQREAYGIAAIMMIGIPLLLFLKVILRKKENKSRQERLLKIDNMMGDEMSQVKTILSEEYKTIYDKYQILGNEREVVQTVQEELFKQFVAFFRS